MRTLFLVIALSPWVGCVGVSEERRRDGSQVQSVQCEPRAFARVDPGSHDSVRLRFHRADLCTTRTEVVLETHTRQQLPEPARGLLSLVVGATVGVPLTVGAVTLLAGSDSNRPVTWDSVTSSGLVILGAVFLAAGITYALAGGNGVVTISSPRREVVKDEQRMEAQPVVNGTFVLNDGPNHALMEGAVELSLEEGLGVREGVLLLNGVQAELVLGESAERLQALWACKSALEEPDTDVQQAKALECRRGGWTFADARLLSPSAGPAAQSERSSTSP